MPRHSPTPRQTRYPTVTVCWVSGRPNASSINHHYNRSRLSNNRWVMFLRALHGKKSVGLSPDGETAEWWSLLYETKATLFPTFFMCRGRESDIPTSSQFVGCRSVRMHAWRRISHRSPSQSWTDDFLVLYSNNHHSAGSRTGESHADSFRVTGVLPRTHQSTKDGAR